MVALSTSNSTGTDVVAVAVQRKVIYHQALSLEYQNDEILRVYPYEKELFTSANTGERQRFEGCNYNNLSQSSLSPAGFFTPTR